MKNILITVMFVITVVTASAQTKRLLFDSGWQFTHNGTTQTVDLPHIAQSYDACLPRVSVSIKSSLPTASLTLKSK